MGKKLYVGGISFGATEDDLKEVFSKIGDVESVKIITDKYTGQSKGFGFVEMLSDEDAKKAIETLNSTTFMGRTIIVNEARPQVSRERKGFGSGRGGFSKREGKGFGSSRGDFGNRRGPRRGGR